MTSAGEIKRGVIYMIPTTLGEDLLHTVPNYVKEIVFQLNEFVVENERTSRRYLIAMGYTKPIDDITFHILDNRTLPADHEVILWNVLKGKDLGVLSEAGCPAIADPGSEIVDRAHEKGIQVIPLVGPSSILLALMASGMNGQNFVFRGYLPKKQHDRIESIKKLERNASSFKQTQIFMETPYRNQHMFDDILKTCKPGTKLCIACDITLPGEIITTKTIKEWQAITPDIQKRQVIWLLSSNR